MYSTDACIKLKFVDRDMKLNMTCMKFHKKIRTYFDLFLGKGLKTGLIEAIFHPCNLFSPICVMAHH